MSHLIIYDRKRRRVWILGQRVHHGTVGILLAMLLTYHDRRDWKVWFVRERPDV